MTVSYRIHEIRYPGETLGEIAEWYTGSAANWRRILNDNGFIKTKSLGFGDKIRINENLMIKTTRMPKSFVKRKPVETESPRAPVNPPVPYSVKERVLKDQLLESIITDASPDSAE